MNEHMDSFMIKLIHLEKDHKTLKREASNILNMMESNIYLSH